MPESRESVRSLGLVRKLQSEFVRGLEQVAAESGEPAAFEKAEWLRDGGRHGGGDRFYSAGNGMFNRASVNVSHVHYQDLPGKELASATALSTIIHPANPHVPSMHMHISWTEMKAGTGYWRMMADLNPAIEYDDDSLVFRDALKGAAGGYFDAATGQGERYFFIPVLERHRGVVHYYLEGHCSGNFEEDLEMAERVGHGVISAYLEIVRRGLTERTDVSPSDRELQLAYHTLYFFQVLTLDRGTTSGLLVHGQNDLGIMGSLPGAVDRALLQSWRGRMPSPQGDLLDALVRVLPESGVVDDSARLHLAAAVREHYRANPGALAMQARGDSVPPTVQNHR